MSYSEVCKQLLLIGRQCLVMAHRGQGCVVIKVAGIIQGLHEWPAPTYSHKLKLHAMCWFDMRHTMPDKMAKHSDCYLCARGNCIASLYVTYLMGAEALLAKHASQSSVLNQGCVLISATPPLKFPILLLKSACTCTEPIESMLSCYHSNKRHHTM